MPESTGYVRDCGMCDGTGHGAAGDEYPCGACDGSGVVPDSPPMPEFHDTCCGECGPGLCYVDQVTGA